MGFSLEEQETVIQISRNRREVHIWTSDKTMMTKLDNLCEKSEEWTCTGQNRINGEFCGVYDDLAEVSKVFLKDVIPLVKEEQENERTVD